MSKDSRTGAGKPFPFSRKSTERKKEGRLAKKEIREKGKPELWIPMGRGGKGSTNPFDPEINRDARGESADKSTVEKTLERRKRQKRGGKKKKKR